MCHLDLYTAHGVCGHAMNSRGFYLVFGYLDDLLVMGSTEVECKVALDGLSDLLKYLWFNLEVEKIVNPSQLVKYLGLNIDSVNMELSLPHEKLDRLCNLVEKFSSDCCFSW